jgi:hypothetical protein
MAGASYIAEDGADVDVPHLTQLPTPMNPDGTGQVLGTITPEDLNVDLSLFIPPAERRTVLAPEDADNFQVPIEGDGDVEGEGATEEPTEEDAGEAVEIATPEYTLAFPSIPGVEWHEERLREAIEELTPLGLSQEQLDQLVGWYCRDMGQIARELSQDLSRQFAQLSAQPNFDEHDRAQAQAAKAELIDELGEAEFSRDVQIVEEHLKDPVFFPGNWGEAIVGARLADGSRLLNSPVLFRYFARMAGRSGYYHQEELQDERAEVEKLEQQRDTNIDEHRYARMWGPDKSMTGSDRLYQLMKKREVAA